MAKEKLLFDKTELVCGILMGNSATVVNVKYSDIIHIKFMPIEEKGFLKMIPSEMIEIKCKNRAFPIVYTMKNEKKYWDKYKAGLVKFAHDNRITLEDLTKQQA